MVEDVLNSWWTEHEHPSVRLITSGCPNGAEAFARQFGTARGWEMLTVRDEELGTLAGAYALVFIKDHSEGASRALAWIEATGMWHRIIRDTTHRDNSPWSTR